MKKKRSQRVHAARRARERFGFTLSGNDQERICQMIRAGEGKFVRKDSNRLSVYDVQFKGFVMRAVYDKHRKSLATVMTPDMSNDIGAMNREAEAYQDDHSHAEV
jgi:hypothetical protein